MTLFTANQLTKGTSDVKNIKVWSYKNGPPGLRRKAEIRFSDTASSEIGELEFNAV